MNQVEQMWAIDPRAIATVMQFLTGHTKERPAKPMPPRRDKVAVIPIRGVLTNDGPAHFGSNYRSIADAAEKAAADPDVKRIVLSVDSPGGQVTGLPETAAVLARVAKVKPISAIVEGTAASAAYWLTSQASDVTITPSGEVGSVGVRMMHVDMSKALEQEGIRVTELHSGDFKTEWSPYKALTDGAKEDMQMRLDETHRDFLKAIADGRGSRVAQPMARSRYGEGRMFASVEALASGLVDRVQSPRDFYRELLQTPTHPAAAAARAKLTQLRLEIQKARLT